MEDVGIVDVIVYVVAGLVIGVLARMILPGRQSMSLVATIVIGIVAAVLGGLAWNALFEGNEGVAWIGSLIVAVVILFIYDRMVAGRGRRAVR